MTEEGKPNIALSGTAIGKATASATLSVHRPLADMDEKHPYFHLIGRVMVQWAQLEHTLDLAIWDLAKHGHSSLDYGTLACITSQVMGPASKCEAIIALAIHKGLPDKIRSQTKTLQGRCGDAQNMRNRMAHDTWFMEIETKEVGRFRKMAKKEPEFGIKDEDDTTLKALLATIRKLYGEALQLRSDVCAELNTLPDRA
jgi:hypothetical protein